jgi:hypothetical protein
MVAHTCNASYLGGRDQESRVQDQHRQKVLETQSQPIKAVYGGMCFATQEA